MHFAFVDPKIQGGIFSDILKRLEDAGAAAKVNDIPGPTEKDLFQSPIALKRGKENIPKRMFERAGYWWQWKKEIDPEYYKYLLDNMMKEVGVKLIYHAFAAGAIREGDTLKGIIIESKEGRKAVMGKVIIDTTGEGDIVWKSGAPVQGGEGVPIGPTKGGHGGMVNSFYISGVDQEKFAKFKKENPQEWSGIFNGRTMIQEAIKEGYHLRDQGVVLAEQSHGRMWTMYPAYAIKDGRCWQLEEQTKAELALRRQMWELHRLLKEKVPGFENSFIDKTPVVPLSSDVHRLLGEYVMTIGDMREGRAFDDAIGISNMVPDLYTLTGQMPFDILPHDIPYRCLISKGIDNLMAAGTTMSSGALAMTGLRYCAPSMIQGHGAGTAAALAVQNNVSPKDVNITMLQEKLREQGAFVTVKDVPEDVIEPYRAIKEITMAAPKSPLYEEAAKY